MMSWFKKNDKLVESPTLAAFSFPVVQTKGGQSPTVQPPSSLKEDVSTFISVKKEVEAEQEAASFAPQAPVPEPPTDSLIAEELQEEQPSFATDAGNPFAPATAARGPFSPSPFASPVDAFDVPEATSPVETLPSPEAFAFEVQQEEGSFTADFKSPAFLSESNVLDALNRPIEAAETEAFSPFLPSEGEGWKGVDCCPEEDAIIAQHTALLAEQSDDEAGFSFSLDEEEIAAPVDVLQSYSQPSTDVFAVATEAEDDQYHPMSQVGNEALFSVEADSYLSFNPMESYDAPLDAFNVSGQDDFLMPQQEVPSTVELSAYLLDDSLHTLNASNQLSDALVLQDIALMEESMPAAMAGGDAFSLPQEADALLFADEASFFIPLEEATSPDSFALAAEDPFAVAPAPMQEEAASPFELMAIGGFDPLPSTPLVSDNPFMAPPLAPPSLVEDEAALSPFAAELQKARPAATQAPLPEAPPATEPSLEFAPEPPFSSKPLAEAEVASVETLITPLDGYDAFVASFPDVAAVAPSPQTEADLTLPEDAFFEGDAWKQAESPLLDTWAGDLPERSEVDSFAKVEAVKAPLTKRQEIEAKMAKPLPEAPPPSPSIAEEAPLPVMVAAEAPTFALAGDPFALAPAAPPPEPEALDPFFTPTGEAVLPYGEAPLLEPMDAVSVEDHNDFFIPDAGLVPQQSDVFTPLSQESLAVEMQSNDPHLLFQGLRLQSLPVLAKAQVPQSAIGVFLVQSLHFSVLGALHQDAFHLLKTFPSPPCEAGTAFNITPRGNGTLGDVYQLQLGSWEGLLEVNQQGQLRLVQASY